MEPLLRIENLHVGYGPIAAIRGVDIEINLGQIVTVIGANGAGKTTLLRGISGILRPTAGRIVLKGQVISGKEAHQIVKKRVIHVPEGRGILARMTVLENLKLGAFARDDRDEIKHDLEQMFRKFPWIEERLDQPGGTLSGGQQQMLAIARGLMARPDLLMLDEPSLGLAPLVTAQIFDIIRDLKKEGKTVLLVEQNTREALKVADIGYVMELGRIVMKDSADALLANEDVVRAYLGAGKT